MLIEIQSSARSRPLPTTTGDRVGNCAWAGASRLITSARLMQWIEPVENGNAKNRAGFVIAVSASDARASERKIREKCSDKSANITRKEYPRDLEKSRDKRPGDIRRRNLSFETDGDLEAAGHSLLNQLNLPALRGHFYSARRTEYRAGAGDGLGAS